MGGHSDSHGHQKVSTPPEELQKLLLRAKVQNFSEVPKYAQSPTSGVMEMQLKGYFDNERNRLGSNFSEAERLWRVKWIQSQNLHPSEPFKVPARQTDRYNIFRRFYRYPLNILENKLSKIMQPWPASIIRVIIGRGVIIYCLSLVVWYQLNYNTVTWESFKGIGLYYTREAVFPGDVRWPMPNPRTESWQHYDLKFHDRKVFLNNTQEK